MAYRNAPHATTNRSPAEMFYGRNLRRRLDLLKPDARWNVICAQAQQSKYHGGKFREFDAGDAVLVRDYRGGQKWMRGKVVKRNGMHYDVQVGPDTCWRRHIEQIIRGSDDNLPEQEPDMLDGNDPIQDASQDTPPPLPHEMLPAAYNDHVPANEAERSDGFHPQLPPSPHSPCDDEQTADVPPDHDEEQTEEIPHHVDEPATTLVNQEPTRERRYPLRNRKQRRLFQMP